MSKLEINPHAKARRRVGALKCVRPSKTVRSQAFETDINNMVKGLTPFTQHRRPAFFIDETILPQDYLQQFNAVLAAQDAFMLLPPDVREKFHNDPAELAGALGDPSRQDELRELGVIAPLQNTPPTSKKATPGPSSPPSGGEVAGDPATPK